MFKKLLLSGVALAALSAPVMAAPPENTIVVGLSADASTFDPAQISSRDNANIAKHLFATLFQVTYEGVVQPYLVEDTKVSDDGLTYNFKLK